MDDKEIVSAIRAGLLDRLGHDRYEVWFGSTTALAVGDHTLTVSVPNQFFQDWLRSHFRKDLEVASMAAGGQPLSIEFRIQPLEAPASIATIEKNPTCVESKTKAIPKGAPHSVASGVELNLIPTSSRPRPCLESFVVGDSNCLAHKAAEIAADKPGTYSPLLIHGSTGTGKTHLLEGVLAAFRSARPRAAAVYLSAEQFTSYFLEALHGSGLPSFRRKYRGLELLAIDDLQFFGNKRATLVELVHTVDTLLRAGKQLVFAADRSPTALKSLGTELGARLAGSVVFRIDPPEYATRLGIVRELARRLDVRLPDDVAGYIAAHLTAHARELAGAIKRLQATSLAHRCPITLSMTEEALAELIEQPGVVIQLADIDRAVCEVFGLNPESLQSNLKANSVSHPRMLAMWLARKHTRAGLNEIGAYFGRRSHSTVISANKRVTALMAKGASLNGESHAPSVEETIRRIEERLRAG